LRQDGEDIKTVGQVAHYRVKAGLPLHVVPLAEQLW
jgi:hypothetical protein